MMIRAKSLHFSLLLLASRMFAQQVQPTNQPTPSASGSDSSSVAASLTNPISSLISVPFQSNFDYHVGPDHDGFKYTLNFQPVIPVKLNDQVNLISRTILPIISQTNASAGGTHQGGLGDTTQSLFFRHQRLSRLFGGSAQCWRYRPEQMELWEAGN